MNPMHESKGAPLFFMASEYNCARSRINSFLNVLNKCPQLSISDSTHSQNISDKIGGFIPNVYCKSTHLVGDANLRSKIQVAVTGQQLYRLRLVDPQNPISSLILPISFGWNRKSVRARCFEYMFRLKVVFLTKFSSSFRKSISFFIFVDFPYALSVNSSLSPMTAQIRASLSFRS